MPWLGLLVVLLGLGPVTRVVAQPTATDSVIRFLQSRAAGDPDDFITFARLGGAYIQKARETGDVTYYGLAEQALKRTLELNPGPRLAAGATAQLALVHFARHEFDEALARAQQALREDPGHLFAYAIVGDAYVELGDYDRATAAYAKALTLSGPAYPHSRLAQLRFLRGDPAGAIDEMRRGVEALVAANVPGENVAWTQVQLGELWFQVGELDKAEAAHRDALASFPNYHRALAGLARVDAARKRYASAAERYRRALAVIPLPEYAAALGDVHVKQGRLQEAKKQYELVQYIGRLNAVNAVIYNRELALFLADHDLELARALELAERELRARRDVYTHDVLAWALFKNGRPRDALAAMTEALKPGTRDARLFFHAGMIHLTLGDTEQARDYLQRALATNPHFHLLHAEVARESLARLAGRP